MWLTSSPQNFEFKKQINGFATVTAVSTRQIMDSCVQSSSGATEHYKYTRERRTSRHHPRDVDAWRICECEMRSVWQATDGTLMHRTGMQ